VTSEDLTSLRTRFEHTLDALNDDSRLYLCKLANAGERAMTARDLLFKENHDLFQQNNESTTRASINSTMVGKGKVLSYEDTVQAQRMRDKKDATATNRRGRRRKSSVPASRRGKKSFAEEVEEAMSAIRASGMESHCFVFEHWALLDSRDLLLNATSIELGVFGFADKFVWKWCLGTF
jgi:hypothetical protein